MSERRLTALKQRFITSFESRFKEMSMSINYVSPNWTSDVDGTKKQAIAIYDLTRLGWQGFDKLDWAVALLAKHPSIPVIMIATHSGSQSSFDALQALAAGMSAEDRHRFRDYIIGKLALEELSCRRNGPGSGASQSLAAMHRCAELALVWK